MSEGNSAPGQGSVVINLGNPAGNPQAVVTPGQNSGDPAAAPALLAAFTNEDNRKYAEQKGWKDHDALLSSYRELETAFSKKGSGQPGQGNGQQAVVAERVVPNAPSDYKFELPPDYPQDAGYDSNLAQMFAGWSHEAKLSASEAKTIHDKFTGHMAKTVQAARAEQTKQFNAAVEGSFADLTKTWGNPGTPGFDRSLEMGRRAIANLDPGLKDALVAHGVIGKDGKGNEVVVNAPIFKALSKVGAQMFQEDSVFGAPAASENPFDPKKPNAAKQGELIRNNPELARSMIAAAGPEAQRDWAWWVAKKA